MNREQVKEYFIRHGLKFQEKTMERAIDVCFNIAKELSAKIVAEAKAEAAKQVEESRSLNAAIQKMYCVETERMILELDNQKLEIKAKLKDALAIIGGAK